MPIISLTELDFQPHPADPRFKNLTGEMFGRLRVLGFAGNRHWYCKCTCGNYVKIFSGNLKCKRENVSCGCYLKEWVVATKTKHGHSAKGKVSAEYGIYNNIIDRCMNPRNDAYKNYGGRGITIWSEWVGENGFISFYNHVGKRPSPQHSLDRIDNNKGYEPGNVHWATLKEQARNMRKNRLITFNNKTQCVAAWAEETGIKEGTIHRRLNAGWPIEKALSVRVEYLRIERRRLAAALQFAFVLGRVSVALDDAGLSDPLK